MGRKYLLPFPEGGSVTQVLKCSQSAGKKSTTWIFTTGNRTRNLQIWSATLFPLHHLARPVKMAANARATPAVTSSAVCLTGAAPHSAATNSSGEQETLSTVAGVVGASQAAAAPHAAREIPVCVLCKSSSVSPSISVCFLCENSSSASALVNQTSSALSFVRESEGGVQRGGFFVRE